MANELRKIPLMVALNPPNTEVVPTHECRVPTREGKRGIPLPAIVFLGGFQAFLVTLFCFGPAFGTSIESVAVARSLAATGQFANAYTPLATGATAHLAPLYPVYLAVLLRTFSAMPTVVFIASLANAYVFGLLLSLLPPIADLIYQREEGIGLTAALIGIAIPSFEMVPQGEMAVFAVGVASFCLLSLRDVRWREWLVGLLAGLTTLTNPAGVLFMAWWLVGLRVLRRWTSKQLSIAVAIAFLVCFPWMLRNAMTLGTFAIRDDLGLEFYLYDNDLSQPSFMSNTPVFHKLSPSWNRSEAEEVKRLGEKRYNAAKFRTAFEWIKTHRLRFVVLSLERYAMFWFPDRRYFPIGYGAWLITGLSLPSMLSAVRRGLSLESLLVGGLVLFSLPYALVNADFRYRDPVVWITLLFAAKTVMQIAGKHSWLRLRHCLRAKFRRIGGEKYPSPT
ncbi:MAG: hypothetical protein JO138_09615 [Acidobacteriaceae bacterium]|nr:hypothetical protein [Acidobacteriaceae bacterium]